MVLSPLPRWFMQFIRRYFKSLLFYGVMVSGISALGEWSSFAVAVYQIGMHYVPASILAFVVGTTINTYLSRTFAFHSKGRTGMQEVALIYATSALAFLFNLATLALCVEWLGQAAMLGKIAGTGVAFFVNFALRQFFIFSANPRWK